MDQGEGGVPGSGGIVGGGGILGGAAGALRWDVAGSGRVGLGSGRFPLDLVSLQCTHSF